MAIGLYCLDVGQAQCIALIGPSRVGYQAALIDVGVAGKQLADWLKRIGVRRIPLVVLTHNHDDHVKGLAALVEAYAGYIGAVKFVVDQPPGQIPFWTPIQEWLKVGKIGAAGQVDPLDTAEPGQGLRLLDTSLASFQLYCIYPTVFEVSAATHKAPLVGAHPGRGANAASAILRLARAREPDRTIALFGGDLTFRGWRRLDEKGHDLAAEVLVVPHHGSDKGATRAYGPSNFAQAVKPRFALFSVGTDNTYGHPAAELIRALHATGATVLCTQITRRCHRQPVNLPGRAVLAPIRGN